MSPLDEAEFGQAAEGAQAQAFGDESPGMVAEVERGQVVEGVDPTVEGADASPPARLK
nr:hypothetical protein [Streptosporangium amethystogenes]